MLISETTDTFRDYLKGSKSPLTVRNYSNILNDFILVVGDKDIKELSLNNVIRYKAVLFAERRLSSGTIATHLSALSYYVTFLQKVYRIELNIFPEDIKSLRPHIHQHIPSCLELWEVSSMVEACHDIEEVIIVKLLFHTGLRAREILSITPSCLKEEPDGTMWLKIKGKGDKERVIPLNDDVKTSVKQYIEFLRLKRGDRFTQNTRLFDYSYSTLWYRLKKIAKRANVSVHPHLLRHTFATSLLSRGVDIRVIAELMGHSSLSSTMRYAKVKPRVALDAVNLLSEVERKNENL